MLRGTLACWEQWAACCTFAGPYRAQVLRSALVLKLLTVSVMIVTLLAVVVVSYRQTIRAHPSGGGSYIVAVEADDVR